MEENKNNCCDDFTHNKNYHCCMMASCSWKYCPLLKYILLILVIVLAFCLGSQYGKLKSKMYSPYGCNMMNWKYKAVQPFGNSEIPINSPISDLE
jgi:hypothetical protein